MVRDNRAVVDIHEIWKVAFVVLATGRFPTYDYDPVTNLVKYRYGQPTTEIFDALEEYGDKKNECRLFAEIYKILRNDTFSAKRRGSK